MVNEQMKVYSALLVSRGMQIKRHTPIRMATKNTLDTPNFLFVPSFGGATGILILCQ